MPRIVPDVINEQTLAIVSSSLSVRDAARLMAEKGVAAVMITEGTRLKGIMTEQDITKRVVAAQLDPDHTKVGDVMTADPDTLRPGDQAQDALHMMRQHKYRHLPVVDDRGNAVGIVSVRDLYAVVQGELESTIKSCESYIGGDGYGTGG
ncbi:CBS domain-containing protein [Haematospirillum jordaniae]|uniref:Histidine kinase n=1 Tax=Haematospirillum jordaniae TaxID=1549855 RepID=A0A143DBH0_9PROT|nr:MULTISPECIES: CBS domain-containing protein [Haematospirillum]AMW34091.1 histidine kinase [Haematospirillum jordaniae]NKD45270.1 CBS domain-containing protein [Haematospirillum jordaniae]NKD57262.1 CBS domain-containing protein [Haematospirillum jordaniae]NKD59616.1 CBS domain-containing protein [Haematospirillum jordaniae]NKD67188.1 CBS domain-containing protein [Haematospirillum jordaniae]